MWLCWFAVLFLFVESFTDEIDEDMLIKKMMQEQEETPETTTVSTIDPRNLPLDLYDIGYVGTWERFCNKEEIEKEFSIYPHHHVLKRIRQTICDLQKKNQINREAIFAFAVYKYCESVKTRVNFFLTELISKFSQDDETKKIELLDDGPLVDCTACYVQAIGEFKKKCVAQENPYFEMFKHLIGRVCIVRWITTEEIVKHIKDVCADKWITDKIDWQPIMKSIKYRDVKTQRI